MWARQESLQNIWSEWHEQRQAARLTAFSTDEFSDTEITKYDLDTAGITGEDNPRSYTTDPVMNQVDGTENPGTDIRTLEDR
jgi:hypothetical protein